MTKTEKNRYKKPLRVHLAKDDVVFFMHIPKTGGISLIKYLDSQFRPEQIFPLHSDADHTLFKTYAPEQFAQYRLVHGHFEFGPYDQGVYQHIAANPVMLTMLRDPIQRVLSAYHHNIRKEHIPVDTTLEQFVTDEQYFNNIYNRETRWLVGAVPGNLGKTREELTISPDAMLYIAKQNLDQFAFVGLTEEFAQSLELLAYTFGWKMPKEIPFENNAPEPIDVEAIPAHILDVIKEHTHLDQALYDYAQKLFSRRRAQMAHELAMAEKDRVLGINLNSFRLLSQQQYYGFTKRSTHLRYRLIPANSRLEYWYRKYGFNRVAWRVVKFFSAQARR